MNETKIGGRIVQKTNRRHSNGVNGDRANGSNGRRGNGANGAHRNGTKRRGGLREPNREAADQRYIDPYEFAPFGYVSFDRAGGVEQANLAACELLGCKRYSLVGASFARWVLPGDLDVYLRHLVRCRGGERRVESKLHLKKRSGEVLSVLLSSTPTKDLRHSRLYQTAIVDLTEHERADEALRRLDERYHTLFDLSRWRCMPATRKVLFRNTTGVRSNYGDGSPDATAPRRASVVPIKSTIPRVAPCRTRNAQWRGHCAAKN